MARRRYDDFHETLNAPIDRDYTSYWPVTNVISAIAGILDALLLIRFVVHLFTSDTAIGLVALIQGLTNWLVAPFDGLIGTTPTTGSGYVDWPALLAVVVISLIAALIMRVTRSADV
ncbi:MAG TPA: hypothetical protein VI322_03780 [Candidatus Saccharimonadia bacterium]